MSGGSYDYLCYKDDEDVFGYGVDHSLEQMADDLAKLGYADDVAQETMQLLLTIRAAKNRIRTMKERLDPVFKAREWWVSCDTNEEEFKRVLAKYRHENTNGTP